MKVGDMDEFVLSVIMITTGSVVDMSNGTGQGKGLTSFPPMIDCVR
jgi:hypothetical protein